jgi:hypothetical protein
MITVAFIILEFFVSLVLRFSAGLLASWIEIRYGETL